MAYPTVVGLQGLPDFATTINWDLKILTLPASSGIFTAPTDDLNIRCESSDIPRKAGQSATVMIRGLPVKQPGIYVPTQQLNLTFVETVDNTMTQFIYTWREACFTTNTGVQLQKDQLTATIQLIRNNRQGNPIWQYTLTGCYLEAYDPGGSLQGQSAEAMRASISLSYDDYTEGPLSGSSSSSSSATTVNSGTSGG
jgi:hypothetical protein